MTVAKRTAKKKRPETATKTARKRTAKKVPAKSVEKQSKKTPRLEKIEGKTTAVHSMYDLKSLPDVASKPVEPVENHFERKAREPVDEHAPGGPYINWGGKHHGEAYSKVPKKYLEWMLNANHKKSEFARIELEARNVVPHRNIRVSANAVDQASLQLMTLFENTRKNFEGLHTWLCRIMQDALALRADVIENGVTQVEYEGCTFNLIPYYEEREHPTRRNGFEISNIRNPRAPVSWNPQHKAMSDQAGRTNARRTKHVGTGGVR